MRRVVLLLVLALPTLAFATTYDKAVSPGDRSEVTGTSVDRPAEGMASGTLFAGEFHSLEMTHSAGEVPHFAVHDSYMLRDFSKHHHEQDCDEGDSCGTVPEPGSLSLLATGLLGLVGLARRKFLHGN